MVRTRQQADAEVQAADPTLMAPIVNPIPSTPASAPRKEGETKKRGSKKLSGTKATTKKANSTKATPKNQSPKSISEEDKVNSRSTSSGKKDHSITDDTAAGLVAKRPKTPVKKGQRKETIKEISKPPSKDDEVRDVDTPGAELAKKEGKAKPKASSAERAIENDTAENHGVSAVIHPKELETAAEKPRASSPTNIPTGSEADPDITETEEELEQRIKDYEKRKRKQARTGGEADPDITETEEELEQRIIDYEERKRKQAPKRKAPIAEVTAVQRSAEPPKKKAKRSAIKTAAAERIDPSDELEKARLSGYSSKKAAAATKKAAKVRKLQTEPTPGTRKSARISGNLDIFSSGDESKPVRRPLKVRFRRRTKTPDIPNNQIGLDENEIFSPYRISTVNNCFLYLVFWLVKLSFLLFYRFLFQSSATFKKVWWAVLAFTLLTFWVPIAGVLSTCAGADSVAAYEACQGQSHGRIVKLEYSCVVNVVSDLAIMALPFWMIKDLKVNAAQKIALGFVFSLAVVCVVLDIVRVIQAVDQRQALYTIIEINFVVIISCLPTYRALLGMKQRRNLRRPSASYPWRSIDGTFGKSKDGDQRHLRIPDRGEVQTEELSICVTQELEIMKEEHNP